MIYRKNFLEKMSTNTSPGTFQITSGDPKIDEARAKLMASIRKIGGASKAPLKKVEDHEKFYRE